MHLARHNPRAFKELRGIRKATMKSVHYVLAGISLALVAFALVAPLDGYAVVELSGEYQVSPGGPPVVLNGTVQEVHAQLLKLNPNWDADFPRDAKPGASTPAKRNIWAGADVSCENRWGAVRPDVIKDGIKYLRESVKGKPQMGAGPGVCARVSCDVAAGIWWCNDDRAPKTLDSFADIGDGAARAQEVCATDDEKDDDLVDWWAGQAFHRTNWNVIVAKC
ncbi:AMSH-like protease sst2 [Purpureocillium lavendulum]|uniref:AMSH-like protease sst2 n=1 Tax=Purpureocillium lavendulum TaxID=1247861 RepID=A0AB34FSJ9_9HYPO|nr:AMSH-like protease sst2 [Purpureocillium lavendulum]